MLTNVTILLYIVSKLWEKHYFLGICLHNFMENFLKKAVEKLSKTGFGTKKLDFLDFFVIMGA